MKWISRTVNMALEVIWSLFYFGILWSYCSFGNLMRTGVHNISMSRNNALSCYLYIDIKANTQKTRNTIGCIQERQRV